MPPRGCFLIEEEQSDRIVEGVDGFSRKVLFDRRRGCAEELLSENLSKGMNSGQAFDLVLAAARAGAEWAWTELYRELSGVVLRYLRGRGAADPEDLTGEVFLNVVRDVASFEGGERDFRAWVLSIARHRLLDDFRRRKRRPVDSIPDDSLREVSNGVDVAAEALALLEANRAIQLMRSLSPDQVDVLLLRVVADLSILEVARILDKRPSAIKALQRRGLNRLRRKLSEESVSR